VVNYCELTQEEYEELSSFPSPSEMSMDIHKAEVHQGSTFRKSPSIKNNNDPNTLYVPWELYQQLPPRVQKLVSEAKKAEPGYVPRKANFHEQVSTDDLAPDIEGLGITGNADGMHTSVANESAHGAGTIDDQALYDHIRGDATMEVGDIRRVLAAKQKRREEDIKQQYAAKKTMVIDGVKWYSANVHNVVYSVSEHHASRQETALVDRGANGGMAGEDVMVVERGVKCATVNGINGHAVQDLPICTVAAIVKSNKGSIIIIMHQYAYLGKGKTIHSSAQMEHYKNIVDDKLVRVGGKQSICNGLAYMDIHVPSSKEYAELPHVVLTSAMTGKILTDDTKQVLYHSTVCSALVPSEHNLHLPHLDNDDSSAPQVIQSWVPLKGEKLQGEHASTLLPMHTIAPDELIGHSILLDANLYHDLITGNAATGILHLVNGTPVDWYSKRQATVETATYGSEFVAAHIATDQVIDLRTTLRYLGVPVKSKSYMFGDNNSVVQSSTLPHSGLNKRHNALSYHRVREAIAAKILGFFHIDGKKNPADVLSKHGGFPQMWPLIKPLLFWRGDTVKCSDGVAEKNPKLKQD